MLNNDFFSSVRSTNFVKTLSDETGILYRWNQSWLISRVAIARGIHLLLFASIMSLIAGNNL